VRLTCNRGPVLASEGAQLPCRGYQVGGFWRIIGGTEATGDVGKTVAVVANAGKDDPAYLALAGKMIRVVGERAQGASVRGAGPEIVGMVLF